MTGPNEIIRFLLPGQMQEVRGVLRLGEVTAFENDGTLIPPGKCPGGTDQFVAPWQGAFQEGRGFGEIGSGHRGEWEESFPVEGNSLLDQKTVARAGDHDRIHHHRQERKRGAQSF